MARNLGEALYDGRPPDSPLLLRPDGSQLTTLRFLELVDRCAGALAALGVMPGDRVSFKLEKRPETLSLAHACLRLGAVLHPLNTAYTREETEYLLVDAEPAVLVCEPSEISTHKDMAKRARARLLEWNDLDCAVRPMSDWAEVGPDATAALLYTSGTTGKPKGAKITHRNLVESARALADIWRLGPSDVLLHALPLYHAHGLLTAVNSLLVSGGSILFLDRFELREVISSLPGATVMMGVPTHYARLLREPDLGQAMSPAFRLAISGSAPLPVELSERFRVRTGRRIFERYGLTEAAIITAVPPDTSDRDGWVGWPLPGVAVRVADASGERAAREATGVLETRGHNVFAGYWKRPDADREAFAADGWFITGDVAEIDREGCVRLLGRSKDLIISGGLNVYPREVEAVLDQTPGIAEAAVFGVPHPDFGEAVVAVAEIEPGRVFEETKVLAGLKGRLAGYKIPKRILVTEQIPRNRLGKVLKSELRHAYRDLFASRPRRT